MLAKTVQLKVTKGILMWQKGSLKLSVVEQ